MDSFKVQIELLTKYGSFLGEVMVVDLPKFTKLMEISKMYHTQGGFDMWLEDGSYVIVPPEVLKDSTMILRRLK